MEKQYFLIKSNTMNKSDLKKFTIKTGIVLDLKPEQITILYTAINLAYTNGWLDSREESFKRNKEERQ